jgi:transcriptional regulator with XRE-family HTH domain
LLKIAKRGKHNGKDQIRIKGQEYLLRVHRLHEGLYSRVAEKAGVDPSYVSRVARGQRKSEKVKAALLSELASIEKREPHAAERL